MDNTFYVYAWTRTDTGEVFYIGKGRGVRDVDKSRRGQHFKNVLAKLDRLGLSPVVSRIAEDLTEQEAFDLERLEIARIGRMDLGRGPLVNKTDGGEGSSGYIATLQTKQKISVSLLKMHEDNPDVRQKLSKAGIKRFDDRLERERQSEINRRSHAENPDRRIKQSAKLKEHYTSPVERQKLSEGLYKRYEDDACRERLAHSFRLSTPGPRNTSGFKGVTRSAYSDNWLAQIRVNEVRQNLGTYPTKELAALAYDRAAIVAWPDGCYLNFPDRIHEVMVVSSLAHAGPKASLRRNNKSGFKGVSFNKSNGTWTASLSIGGKARHIGYYLTAEDAARSYDAAAFDAWGMDCYLNFPLRIGEPAPEKHKSTLGRKNGPSRNNTSGYKGVSYVKKANKWAAQIRVSGKNKSLGYFRTAEAAARAYDAVAYVSHGADCFLNFPEEIKALKAAA